MKYALDIPNFLPATVNELMRSVSNRIRRKREDRGMIMGYALLGKVPKAKGKRRVKITLTLGPRNRQRDPDSSFKSCLDGMVCAGLLIDDSPEYVELLPVEFRRGPEKATRIELEDVMLGEQGVSARKGT